MIKMCLVNDKKLDLTAALQFFECQPSTVVLNGIYGH